MSDRIALSKRVRFEIFKRDGFTCQYCGAHPPSVILHIDHIKAVAEGGSNDMDNLLTACLECNLGKGARDLTVVPQSLRDKAAEVEEREAQILGYESILSARRDRVEGEMWEIAEVLKPGSPEKGMNRAWLVKIKDSLDKLGFDDTLNSAEIARARFPNGSSTTFAYFCGIVNRKFYKDDRGGRFVPR